MVKATVAVKTFIAILPPALSLGAPVPYVGDDSTIALYHFDETSGAADPGTAFANFGNGGATLNLANTGGFDGRDNDTGTTFVVGGGYGAAAYSGFGSAFDPVKAGDGTIHTSTSGSATGGGASTAANTIPQSALQGSDGAFTYEAIVKFNNLAGEQNVISHDNGNGTNANRGFNFGVVQSGGVAVLRLGSQGANVITATIPTTGTHGFDSNQWYHVAVSYTGEANAADNLKLYWTALNAEVTQANMIGSATLAQDLPTLVNGNPSTPLIGYLGVGTHTRSVYRLEVNGLVDEVRLSGVARGPDAFLVVPEPANIAVLALSGLALLHRRRN